jgi:hypothetical protein
MRLSRHSWGEGPSFTLHSHGIRYRSSGLINRAKAFYEMHVGKDGKVADVRILK